ncbi:MAG: hypothetical protein V4685_04500 [Bacteroidota bacterium]
MKNIQTSTPGFVLTSLSFRQTDGQKAAHNGWQQTNIPPHSSITKFDYCLPPDELIAAETSNQTQAA